MELDFNSVKALASPTRIEILRTSMEQDATPTSLASELEKSKSTISSHLDTLTEAGLLKKESEDGRKRVIYRPTDKAEAIASGKERKVRFSFATTGISGVVGAVLTGAWFTSIQKEPTSYTGEMGVQATESAATAQESGILPEEIFLIAGIGFFTIALGSIAYGLLMKRIGS